MYLMDSRLIADGKKNKGHKPTLSEKQEKKSKGGRK